MTRRILMDPSTGEQFDVEVDSTGGGGGAGAAPPDHQQFFNRTAQASDKQLDVFLTQTSKPERIQKLFWALTYKLGLIKITSPAEQFRLKMWTENLLRLYFLSGVSGNSNGATPPDDEIMNVLEADLLEFDAYLEMTRSITYDGRPNEREQWTPVMVRQTITDTGQGQPGLTTSGGPGLIGSVINRVLGRRH